MTSNIDVKITSQNRSKMKVNLTSKWQRQFDVKILTSADVILMLFWSCFVCIWCQFNIYL